VLKIEDIIKVKITEEMIKRAREEAAKRDPDINHHFEVSHFTSEERDLIGFIGEFAACSLLGIEWVENIRGDYKTIDDNDLVFKNKKIDVKTETVPQSFIQRIASRKIFDNAVYGRRLINKGQGDLLSKYDIVFFGLIDRESLDYWYPIGWIETSKILGGYSSTTKRPDGGSYPFEAFPIKTSELKDIKELT
jgi:hypothetical protein